MPFVYQSGERVQRGDRVLYAGEACEVEFVADGPTGDAAMDWNFTEFPGGGFMVKGPPCGSVFLTNADEDLEFVSRRG